MEALLEAKNQELYELQQALLDCPRKQRKEMKQRVKALDAEIATLSREHKTMVMSKSPELPDDSLQVTELSVGRCEPPFDLTPIPDECASVVSKIGTGDSR